MGTIREVFILEDRATPVLKDLVAQMTASARAVSAMTYSLNNIETATAATATAVDNLAGAIQGAGNRATQARSPFSGLASSIKSFVGAYVGLQGVKGLIGLSDTMTQTTARLDMMNDGLQTTAELNQMIYESAQRSRGAYQDTAAMVAQLGNLAGNAFNNNTADIVAFAEQINKHMTLSGASTQAANAAMLQLTQAMSSGVLRGEELNSVLEQAPTIAQAIASYMGVTTGQMREMASEGAISAEVVKNAMFNAAEEVNEKFESMPMTWAQVWTSFQNTAIMALQPVLDVINEFANHFDQIAPVLAGAGAGALAAAVGLKVMAAATWIANGAAKTFFTTLLTNPLTYIAVGVGLAVYAIYQWVQSVGGLRVAWLLTVDNVLYAWDTLKIGFMTGVYAVMNWMDNLSLVWQATGIAIQNWMGDTKVNVLTLLQDMANGAIGILNGFIEQVNKIPGVAISPIQQMTFAATAATENEAAKQARVQQLTASTQVARQNAAERANLLAAMTLTKDQNRAARQQEIQKVRIEQMAGSGNETPWSSPYSTSMADDVSSIAESAGRIEKSVSMSEEDLKSLVDMAERRYVNNINLNAPTPVINITGQNTGNTAADRQSLADTIRDILLEQVAAGSTRNTAY